MEKRIEYKNRLIMLDVESTDLFNGMPFAWGAVVLEFEQEEDDPTTVKAVVVDKKLVWCHHPDIENMASDWVKEHVMNEANKHLITHNLEHENHINVMYAEFTEFMNKHLDGDTDLWVDCMFPVEATFLTNWENWLKNGYLGFLSELKMPYPVYDLSTILHVDINRAGFAGFKNMESDHNPVHDALHSGMAAAKRILESRGLK